MSEPSNRTPAPADVATRGLAHVRAEDAYVITDSLAASYYRALDDGDRLRWLSTFEPDGQLLLSGQVPIVGADGLTAYWAARPARLANRKHVVTDVQIVRFDADAIRAIAEFTTVDLATGAELAVGSSSDLLRRTRGGRWKYAVKKIELSFRSPEL